MKFRGTAIALGLVIILGGFVYWHEVVGGNRRDSARRAAQNLLSIDRAQIQKVRIRHSGTQFELRMHNGVWVMDRPVVAECDAGVVGAFMDSLVAARREDTVGRGKLERYGLDSPAAYVEIDLGDRMRKLALGRINPQQTLVYTLVDDSKDVVLTSSSLLTQALTNAFGWRDKRMIEVQPELVKRIRVRTIPAPPLTIVHDAEHGWIVEGQTPWRFDPVRARSLLIGLAQLQAVGVAAENKVELERFGIDNKRFSAQIENANRSVLGDLVIGHAKEDGSLFAIVPDKPEVWLIDGKLGDVMVATSFDPRDHKALPPFDNEKVTRIAVTAPDDRFVLELRGTEWKVASSTKHDSTFALDSGSVAKGLVDLRALPVQEFPESQPAPALYQPALITIVLYEGDKKVSGIEFGQKDPKGLFTFARGLGEPAVFLISPAALIELPIDIERMQANETPLPEGAERS